MNVLLLTLLILLSVAIACQDFRSRRIHLWLIVAFGVTNAFCYLINGSAEQLAENSIFCTVYFLFSFMVLWLYYFIKTRRVINIMDKKIGWGDVLVFFFTGICLEPGTLVYFFTIAFSVSALVHLLFSTSKRTVALAGLVLINYIAYILFKIIAWS